LLDPETQELGANQLTTWSQTCHPVLSWQVKRIQIAVAESESRTANEMRDGVLDDHTVAYSPRPCRDRSEDIKDDPEEVARIEKMLGPPDVMEDLGKCPAPALVQ
jgi:hypothetical protein